MGASTLTDTNAVACPKCGGQMYDNRGTKKNVKQPDFKCKNYRVCDGVIWPPKGKPADVTPINPKQPEQAKKPTMREAYKQLTEWVISDIVPLYAEDIDNAIPADVVASITATLFIQACKSGKVE